MDRKPDTFQENISYEPDSLFLFHHNFSSDDYAKHWHNAVEIIMPVQNAYTVIIGEQEYNLRENDILIIPPGELHEIKAPKGKGRRIFVQFSIEALNTIRGFIKASYVYMNPWLITPENNSELNQSLKTLLLEMLDEFLNRSVYYNVAITGKIIEITLHLTRKKFVESDSQFEALIKRREHTERFNECLDYINRHYSEGLTLESVAQAVCFSKFHFSRWFRENAKLSFHDYLTKLRIDKAEAILLSTSLPVTEIALEAGFQSTSTFNRLFRKHKNCTPTEYRHLYHTKQIEQELAAPPQDTGMSAEKMYVSAPLVPADVPTEITERDCTNPILFADVPDPDVIRVGNVYYMVSTTMYFCPGAPIMKSEDLVNWEIVNYVYDILDDSDRSALRNGAHSYGKGSWAASLRYNKGVFYVVFVSFSTGKTYVFQTSDIENGPWQRHEINEIFHDPSLLFDDDGRVYIVYGGGAIHLVELNADATAPLEGGRRQVIIEKANVAGDSGLPAEGAHMYKIDGKYYLFLIAWPKTGTMRRVELCYRADSILGPYEGRVVLDDNLGFRNMGVAQGGIVDSPDGSYYAMLFQDHGAVGRIPVLVPVAWQDGWPVFGVDGRVPANLGIRATKGIGGIVTSDEFYPPESQKSFIPLGSGEYRYAHLPKTDMAEECGSSDELIVNHNFTDGLAGWSVMEIAEISISKDESYNGNPALCVRNRSTTASGPRQIITGKVAHGRTYEALAWVKYNTGPSHKTFNMCMINGASWEGIQIMGSGRLTRGEWGVVRGTYTLPDDADLSETAVFIETPWSDKPSKEIDMMDFYVGRVSLVEKQLRYYTAAHQGENDPTQPCLALAWQWNHNPDHNLWSITERQSHLRLKSAYLCHSLMDAKNTLTQRTFGPRCSGAVSLDTAAMRDGDVAGLAALQEIYGYVGVRMTSGEKFIVMVSAESDKPQELCSIPLENDVIYLRAEFNFNNETVRFFYSMDESVWRVVGEPVHMQYKLSHFTGYRFALFYYSTQTIGGHADFDYFRLGGSLVEGNAITPPLNASILGDKTIRGQKGEVAQVSIHMDSLAEDCKGVYLSLPIPSQFDVEDVVFCHDNIYGKAEYTCVGERLKISIKGAGALFKNTVSDQLASLRLVMRDYAANDTVVQIKPDYVFAEGSSAVINCAPHSIDIMADTAGAVAKTPGLANPLVTHKLGADPWALEYDGRVYLYLTGDKYEYNDHGHLTDNTYGKINTLNVFSSADLINWTDHGAIDVAGENGAAKWATQSWAPAVAYKKFHDGDRFFLYFANNGTSIGVLTARSPLGPWSDPLGAPVVHRGIAGAENVTWCFDPAVLVDDDGSGYLYFGGGLPSESDFLHPKTARVVRLGDDMISTVGSAVTIDAPAFFEDSGIHKMNGMYYYSYCSNFAKPHPSDYPRYGEIAYMISDNPMGPFNYVGTILKNPEDLFGIGGNNHHCIFTFKDSWYIAYHTQTLSGAVGRAKGYRSPHINALSFYGNGRIRPVAADMRGVRAVATHNPFEKTPAATFAWNAGVETTQEESVYVARIRSGSWLAVANADFGSKGASRFTARIASRSGGEIEIRVNSLQGKVLGTLGCGQTSGKWAVRSCDIAAIHGVCNLFFVFKGDSDAALFDFDYWVFD